MIRTIFLKLLGALQRRCEHPPTAIKADLFEGDQPGVSVLWCEICGAVAVRRTRPPMPLFYEFRRPCAEWHTAKELKTVREALRLREERMGAGAR